MTTRGGKCLNYDVTPTALHYIHIVSMYSHILLMLQSGLDVNSLHRVLLRSVKPVLHASVDCTALIAAVVCRQASVVKYLLQVSS